MSIKLFCGRYTVVGGAKLTDLSTSTGTILVGAGMVRSSSLFGF